MDLTAETMASMSWDEFETRVQGLMDADTRLARRFAPKRREPMTDEGS